jgi:hypothetical protein
MVRPGVVGWPDSMGNVAKKAEEIKKKRPDKDLACRASAVKYLDGYY